MFFLITKNKKMLINLMKTLISFTGWTVLKEFFTQPVSPLYRRPTAVVEVQVAAISAVAPEVVLAVLLVALAAPLVALAARQK